MDRRSTRSFRSDEVSRSLISEIIEVGQNAPSGMNEQPWHFTVITDRAVLESLNERIGSFSYSAPALIIVSMKRGACLTLQDTGCVMTNMMHASRALGLGCVWCNQVLNKDLRDFGVPEGYDATASLALGYAASAPGAKKIKKDNINWI